MIVRSEEEDHPETHAASGERPHAPHPPSGSPAHPAPPAGSGGPPPSPAKPKQLFLFPELEARSPDEIRALLEARVKAPVRLSITKNRTCVFNWKREGDGTFDVRMQRVFLEAPDDVIEAIVSFVERPTKQARERVTRYFTTRPEARPAKAPAPAPELFPRGVHHDLAEIFAALNAAHFEGRVRSQVGWGAPSQGRRPSGRLPKGAAAAGAPSRDACGDDEEDLPRRGKRPARTIRFGSYVAEHDLIRVHPALDQAWVPRFFVESIVHHEMLHAVIPIVRDAFGRRVIHPPEFKDRERLFPHHDAALVWEKANLHKLVDARG